MKRSRLAVLAAFIIISTYGLSDKTIVAAGQNNALLEAENESLSEEPMESGDTPVSEIPKQNPEAEADSQEMPQDNFENKESEDENSVAVSLQIPQQVDIVIDPLEIKGRGQIYSEQYKIHNAGETAGVLTITNYIVASLEQNGIVAKADRTGLHQGPDKMIYLEMAFENGEAAAFSQEGATYTIRLEPDEELAFWFIGEVNENTSYPWKDGDVSLRIDYEWEMEEKDSSADESGEYTPIEGGESASQEPPPEKNIPTEENETSQRPAEGNEVPLDGDGEKESEPAGGNEDIPADVDSEKEQEPAGGNENVPADVDSEKEREPAGGNESVPADVSSEKEREPAGGNESVPADVSSEKEQEPAEGNENVPADENREDSQDITTEEDNVTAYEDRAEQELVIEENEEPVSDTPISSGTVESSEPEDGKQNSGEQPDENGVSSEGGASAEN